MGGRILIDGREVSDDAPCYVIAEIGGNHQGEIEKALEMIRVAKQCAADAVKFQKRNNRELYTKAFYDRPYDHRNSYGPTYGLHREALELDEKQFGEVVACARDVGITLLSTPFDVDCAGSDRSAGTRRWRRTCCRWRTITATGRSPPIVIWWR